ncbi:non-ribosomal peptide synthetase component F [Streptosporangium album]|uniref:Non-ribosomal peptide synthetase component F n=1 Tax=Streptosporangium album TaxID=47479 RepID=A0A7W7S3C7_9ACTN|nr:AMP-binding protein [Streptosporangium album]MBB4943165.1 non-ribosomal peptide synthetase component F [Streptosporangium album]
MNPLSFRNNLAELFEARVAAAPDAEAVVSGQTRLTAAELNGRANALARRLTAAGVGPETPVMALLQRSADVMVTLLAVIKAGGTYVPLHPDLPLSRMRWIAEKTGAPVIVTDTTHTTHDLMHHLQAETGGTDTTHTTHDLMHHLHTMVVGTESDPENLNLDIDPHRLAYTMFTSGSTGEPKGVAVTHRNVASFAADHLWNSPHQQRVLFHTAPPSTSPCTNYGSPSSTAEPSS